jgi:hypothetical protein
MNSPACIPFIQTEPSFTGDLKSGLIPEKAPFEKVRYNEQPTAQNGHIVFTWASEADIKVLYMFILYKVPLSLKRVDDY